jgi:hypothetical protein
MLRLRALAKGPEATASTAKLVQADPPTLVSLAMLSMLSPGKSGPALELGPLISVTWTRGLLEVVWTDTPGEPADAGVASAGTLLRARAAPTTMPSRCLAWVIPASCKRGKRAR